MSTVSKQIIDMIEMLPESEQELAFEMIKRMVLAWDSDFTKLTPLEREINPIRKRNSKWRNR